MRTLFLLTLVLSGSVIAQETEIKNVFVSGSGGQYRFNVTLAHADAGWDHYANVWQVQDEEGAVLAERILAHPHVNEQPFTRSLSATVDSSVKQVYIVAGCTLDGLHPQRFKVGLP